MSVLDTVTPSPRLRRDRRRTGAASLSVCCMTSGRRPALLAGVLASLRDVAHEIVVAVEAPRAEEVHAAVAAVADSVLAFPPTSPADRPIAWLFRACSRSWIFNIDDDEVPSRGLVAALPELVSREDLTHAWVARRWLFPAADTYIGSRPWGTEFQLRLVRADARFLQFSDHFHRPVVCHGPSAYVEAPLWHLDAVLNSAAHRRIKASRYEHERPGMRLDGLAHNEGLYLPELQSELELLPVPDEEREAIGAARDPSLLPSGPHRAVLRHVSAEEVDRAWVGAPHQESLYRATLKLAAVPSAMVAGGQHTVDVCVTNESELVWGWGRDARPEIRLAYRWRRRGEVFEESKALRTTFPADVAPGTTAFLPVHVVAPVEPGVYELEIDLVHEHVRWFGAGIFAAVEVRGRQRMAVIARPERITELLAELELGPEIEPVVLLRDLADRDAYGDYESVVGLRPYLLAGTDRRSRLATLARLLWRTMSLARRRSDGHWSRPEYEAVLSLRSSTEQLIVDGPNWGRDAAAGREWSWVTATALLWRQAGRPVLIADGALPAGGGAGASAARWVLSLLRTSR